MIYECYLFFEDEVVDKGLHHEGYLSIALLLILLKQPFYLRNMAHLEQLLNLLKVIFLTMWKANQAIKMMQAARISWKHCKRLGQMMKLFSKS